MDKSSNRGYKCKCRITGESGYTNEFYRVKVGNRNTYYKNEQVYLDHKVNMAQRKKLLSLLAFEIFNYQRVGMISPGILKKIKTLNNTYSYSTMVNTVKKHAKDLQYWAGRQDMFNSETHKQFYIFAIIEDKILDVHMEEEKKKSMKKVYSEDKASVDLLNIAQEKQNNRLNDGRVDISQFIR